MQNIEVSVNSSTNTILSADVSMHEKINILDNLQGERPNVMSTEEKSSTVRRIKLIGRVNVIPISSSRTKFMKRIH